MESRPRTRRGTEGMPKLGIGIDFGTTFSGYEILQTLAYLLED